jgi:hypothetical protein
MNLIALANCPTEPAHAQWISLNPHSEWFRPSLHYGATKAASPEQNQLALFKLATT